MLPVRSNSVLLSILGQPGGTTRYRFIVLLLIFASSIAYGQKKRILIYTHNGKGYVHENIAASVEALTKLCTANNWAVESSDSPTVFTSENLKRFNCIIFSNTNNEGFDNDAQKDAFVAYTRAGGGFVGIHSASGSERKWPWFAAMLGGRFVRHPELQPFTIKVIDKKHPSTEFLGEIWSWEDECYYTNNLNPDINVLLAVDLTTIKDDKKVEYPGQIFGDYFPLAWCHEFDGGRQFYTSLGHKAEYYQNEKFLKHLKGGIEWAIKN
jgi:type 1 glutamine amidotransferase